MRQIFCIMLLASATATAQNGSSTDPSHYVPAEKGLNPSWQQSLTDRSRRPFSGDQLNTIGMPCGGIASGQLYVRGDGTLAGWWIANNAYNTGYGAANKMNFNTALGPWKVCYQTFTPFSYIEQGFTIALGKDKPRPLDKTGFDEIYFTGEYPVATIDYNDKVHPLKMGVSLQVFSPFIPLDARESATPGTVLQYSLTNSSRETQTVTLTGRLQNLVGLDLKGKNTGMSRNRIVREKGMLSVMMDLVNSDLPAMHPYNGNLGLSLLSEKAFAQPGPGVRADSAEKPLGEPLTGAVGTTLTLRAGESRTITFLLSWYFPNRPTYTDADWNHALSTKGAPIGNNYANWFDNSLDVARWLRDNLGRLRGATMAFHDAYYDQSTIPYWLNRRLLMPVSTLATETCQWWATGKFWAWEGVGSCIGTCTHVWNYEQGMAHLFPELDRNIREETDLSVSMQADGSILARNGEYGVLIDGDAGTLLKAWREHLMSKDNLFLARNWDHLKRAARYLIRVDSNADGLIEGVQPNTYDIAFYGANTYVGSLYLGALRAAGQMARLAGDSAFADSCQLIADRGSRNTSKRLFNGEYFIQDVDLKVHPESQYGTGCLSDQLFGQTLAHLDGLGYLYPKEQEQSALRAIWKYNWAPDVGIQTRHHKAERDYADPGEAGLLICTWPHSLHPGEKGVRYRDEVWTGIEYQVATNMIYEGMTEEGISIIKGLDERYQPQKHNPWNEIECGDHYARAMASWGVLLALEDFRYDGPQQSLGFAPRIQPEHFSAFFSAAEGWGVLKQERGKNIQTNTLSLRYGSLTLKTLELELPAGEIPKEIYISAGGERIVASHRQNGKQLKLYFPVVSLHAGEELTVRMIIL